MDNSTIITPEQTEFLRCSSCDKPILRIYEKVKSSTKLYQIVAACCFCGDKTFPKNVYGEFNFMPADGVSLGDVKVDDVNKITTFLTSRRK